LTPDEKRLYGQLFRIADSEQLGVITGPVAVEFFKKSGLTPALLAEVLSFEALLTEIWGIADTDNQGFLTQKTWSIALRLIAHAQKGEQPSSAMSDRRMLSRRG
jgi:epidermal growth factor receptor substrate 15